MTGDTERNVPKAERAVVFISKATPGDDEFVLWLAPRLEAEGYTVFADILSLAKDGVQEEIGIAEDVGEGAQRSQFHHSAPN